MPAELVEFCDCNHRRTVHYTHAVKDLHGDIGSFRTACALTGCACSQFTQQAQREARGTRRLLDDIGGVSAKW